MSSCLLWISLSQNPKFLGERELLWFLTIVSLVHTIVPCKWKTLNKYMNKGANWSTDKLINLRYSITIYKTLDKYPTVSVLQLPLLL